MAPAEGATGVVDPRAPSATARRRAPEAAEDSRLLECARGGNRAALDELIQRCRLPLWRFSFRLTGSRAEADDLAQETLVRALRALEGFRGDAAFRTWLMRIASNLWIETAGKVENRRRDERTPEQLDRGRSAGLVERLIQKESQERLRSAVAGLPPRQRATLVLKVYQDLTLGEVADVLGSPIGTVKANYHHALERLRRELRTGDEP
jgi:RNA polymerase sigma-70 factor (ECF subfamily)